MLPKDTRKCIKMLNNGQRIPKNPDGYKETSKNTKLCKRIPQNFKKISEGTKEYKRILKKHSVMKSSFYYDIRVMF